MSHTGSRCLASSHSRVGLVSLSLYDANQLNMVYPEMLRSGKGERQPADRARGHRPVEGGPPGCCGDAGGSNDTVPLHIRCLADAN